MYNKKDDAKKHFQLRLKSKKKLLIGILIRTMFYKKMGAIQIHNKNYRYF